MFKYQTYPLLMIRHLEISPLQSKVFSVKELVALSQDNISGIAKFVLFTHIAHIKELFIVLDEERS